MSQPALSRAGTGFSGVYQRDHPTTSAEEETTSAVDLEAGNDQEQAKGFLSMSARVQQDKSQLVTRRFTEPTMVCLAWGASRILQLFDELRETEEHGMDALEKNKRYFEFREELDRHHHFTLQAKEIHGLDQPSATFIKNFRLGARADLDDEDAKYLSAPRRDFVSVLPIDKLDKLVWDLPHRPFGKLLLSWFQGKTTEKGDIQFRHYPQKTIKMVLSGVFNCIVGGLIGAPVAIQLLAVDTKLGAVILYLVFLLAFAFLVQGIAHGTNTQLYMTLAYAGVLAAIMK